MPGGSAKRGRRPKAGGAGGGEAPKRRCLFIDLRQIKRRLLNWGPSRNSLSVLSFLATSRLPTGAECRGTGSGMPWHREQNAARGERNAVPPGAECRAMGSGMPCLFVAQGALPHVSRCSNRALGVDPIGSGMPCLG